MPPKKKGSTNRKQSEATTQQARCVLPSITFPVISQKENLECRAVLEDQILVVNDFLSPLECKEYVKFIDSLPLELTPPKKRGEADRVNHRFSVISPDFAQKLHTLLTPHLRSFPYPTSYTRRRAIANLEGDPAAARRHPHSFNSNIRVYKYTAGQHFGPHYDDSVKDPMTGATSEWTLLVYLTGSEDGVEGGETVFYREQKGVPRETITPPLQRGAALLHRHGIECLLHEGSPVLKGTKYVLRSDLMFM